MSDYSEKSEKLARALAEKAARNLRATGHSVKRNATTGRYVVSKGGSDFTIARDDSGVWIARRGD
mgnify:CR=1 FL=1